MLRLSLSFISRHSERQTVPGGDFAPFDGRNSFAACLSFFPSTNPEAGTHREEVIKNLSGIWWPILLHWRTLFPAVRHNLS